MSSPQPHTLEEKIAGLAPEVDAPFRQELPLVLSTLRAAHNPKGVLLQMSPLALHVMREVFKGAGQAPPNDNLWACIMRAGRGEPTQKIEGLGFLPRAIETYLHPLRIVSNQVDHRVEELEFTAAHAEHALASFLLVLEWFYCQYEHGPRLPSMYGRPVGPGYVLYGDPTVRYLPATQEKPRTREAGTARQTPPRSKSTVLQHRTQPLILGAGALVLLSLALAVFFWGKTRPGAFVLTLAYQALEQRDWPQAQTLFQQLGASQEKQAQSQGYAGLAALALARQEYPQALTLAEQAESVDPEIGYSHVIRGHILANQGKLVEAVAEYQVATAKSHSVPWQQALAHNRLGWLYAAQGDAHKALEQYDRALSRSQDIAAVYTNKAYLLAQLGKRQEAMTLYRQALQVAPDDQLATTLLREAERREQLALDKEQQAHLEQLVTELLQAHKEGRKRDSPGDGWTSTPLTLAFLEPQRKGSFAPRAGEEESLWLSMAQALRASGRMHLVEREILDKLLAELKLSASELVDPQVALRIGQILAARLIATGSFIRSGDAAQLNVRLVETETTRIRASGAAAIEQPETFDSVVEQLVRALLTQVRQAYPLQGRIARITPQAILLDIGAEQGVTPGLTMQVFGSEEPLMRDGKVVGSHHTPVGLIEVSSVEAQLAQARVLEQTAAFQEGWKVRERGGE